MEGVGRGTAITSSRRAPVARAAVAALCAVVAVAAGSGTGAGALDRSHGSVFDLLVAAHRSGMRCEPAPVAEGSTSCLVAGRFTQFYFFDERRPRAALVRSVHDLRAQGAVGNHLVVGPSWVVLTASAGVARHARRALGGRLDVAPGSVGGKR